MTLDNILRELILWQNPRTPVEDKISYAKTRIKQLVLKKLKENMEYTEYNDFWHYKCRGNIESLVNKIEKD